MSSAEEAVSRHPGLLDWLLHGEVGISSQTIVSVLTGHKVGRSKSEPYDCGDFRRCELLLRQVPSLRLLFPAMREESKWWSYLVDNWSRIVETFEDEAPGAFGQSPSWKAPKTYALIKAGRGGKS